MKGRGLSIFVVLALVASMWVALPAQKAAAATTVTFTTSGSWTAPAGVTSITVEVWGGGGRGGSHKR